MTEYTIHLLGKIVFNKDMTNANFVEAALI